jgi:hypothetical protein
MALDRKSLLSWNVPEATGFWDSRAAPITVRHTRLRGEVAALKSVRERMGLSLQEVIDGSASPDPIQFAAAGAPRVDGNEVG